jgi:osmotically-inducible protein OsmY
MKNGRQIQQEVLAELHRDRNIPKDAIGVEVHHGVVKIDGAAAVSLPGLMVSL